MRGWKLSSQVLLLVLVACARDADVEPLADTSESARPFDEAQLAALDVPAALVRALPSGPETPVFALSMVLGREAVGFRFEVADDRANLHARGLRRLASRLSPDAPAAVWLEPAVDGTRRTVAVMTVLPLPWRMLIAAEVPDAVDRDLVERLLESEDGPRATLHEVGPDHLTLEFDRPADVLADRVFADDGSNTRAYVEWELASRRLTLPVQ